MNHSIASSLAVGAHAQGDREGLPEGVELIVKVGDFFSGCIEKGEFREFMRILTTFLGTTNRNPS